MRNRVLLENLQKASEKAKKLKLPGKQIKLLQKMNKNLLEKRIQELSQFLESIVKEEELRECEAFQEFVKTDVVSVEKCCVCSHHECVVIPSWHVLSLCRDSQLALYVKHNASHTTRVCKKDTTWN